MHHIRFVASSHWFCVNRMYCVIESFHTADFDESTCKMVHITSRKRVINGNVSTQYEIPQDIGYTQYCNAILVEKQSFALADLFAIGRWMKLLDQTITILPRNSGTRKSKMIFPKFFLRRKWKMNREKTIKVNKLCVGVYTKR